jgi:hypothetical protein
VGNSSSGYTHPLGRIDQSVASNHPSAWNVAVGSPLAARYDLQSASPEALDLDL